MTPAMRFSSNFGKCSLGYGCKIMYLVNSSFSSNFGKCSLG